jgi:hypothetical protein
MARSCPTHFRCIRSSDWNLLGVGRLKFQSDMIVEFEGSRNQCLGPPFEPRFPRLSKHLHMLVATCRGGIRPGWPSGRPDVADQTSHRLPPLRTPLWKASESLLLKTKVAAESVWNRAPKKWVKSLLGKNDAHKAHKANKNHWHGPTGKAAAHSAVMELTPNDAAVSSLVSDIVAAMQIMQEVESRAAKSRMRCSMGGAPSSLPPKLQQPQLDLLQQSQQLQPPPPTADHTTEQCSAVGRAHSRGGQPRASDTGTQLEWEKIGAGAESSQEEFRDSEISEPDVAGSSSSGGTQGQQLCKQVPGSALWAKTKKFTRAKVCLSIAWAFAFCAVVRTGLIYRVFCVAGPCPAMGALF